MPCLCDEIRRLYKLSKKKICNMFLLGFRLLVFNYLYSHKISGSLSPGIQWILGSIQDNGGIMGNIAERRLGVPGSSPGFVGCQIFCVHFSVNKRTERTNILVFLNGRGGDLNWANWVRYAVRTSHFNLYLIYTTLTTIFRWQLWTAVGSSCPGISNHEPSSKEHYLS